VFAAFLLTFVPATGDYVNASILGGPGTTMIGNIIQEKFLVELNYPEAAAMSVILMLAMLVLASVYARILGTEDDTLTAAI
jgi:spermidine/putrescine transport system permease protein